jgi:hypothetical protein
MVWVYRCTAVEATKSPLSRLTSRSLEIGAGPCYQIVERLSTKFTSTKLPVATGS